MARERRHVKSDEGHNALPARFSGVPNYALDRLIRVFEDTASVLGPTSPKLPEAMMRRRMSAGY
jgi:hypothetical protein